MKASGVPRMTGIVSRTWQASRRRVCLPSNFFVTVFLDNYKYVWQRALRRAAPVCPNHAIAWTSDGSR